MPKDSYELTARLIVGSLFYASNLTIYLSSSCLTLSTRNASCVRPLKPVNVSALQSALRIASSVASDVA